jgi:hypothetical protein
MVRTLVHGSTMDPRWCGGRELNEELTAAKEKRRGDDGAPHRGNTLWKVTGGGMAVMDRRGGELELDCDTSRV